MQRSRFIPILLLTLVILATLVILGLVYYFCHGLAIWLMTVVACAMGWLVFWLLTGNREAKPGDDGLWTNPRTRYRIVAVLMMSGIYLSSMKLLELYMLPPEENPYFLNADYHFIYNSGVSFEQELVLYTDAQRLDNPGLFHADTGSLTAFPLTDGGVQLAGPILSLPVFVQARPGKKTGGATFTPAYCPYNTDVSRGFAIRTADNDTRLAIEIKVEKRPGDHDTCTYIKGHMNCRDPLRLAAYGETDSLDDTFLLRHPGQIRIGYGLQDLLVNRTRWDSGSRLLTREMVSDWLRELDSCYLLARYTNTANSTLQRDYVFFPSRRFLSERCVLEALNSDSLPYKPDVNIRVRQGTQLYVGFENRNGRFRFERDSTSGNTLMTLHVPRYFSMSPRGARVPAPGVQYLRLLCNHYSGFLSSAHQEGFLFHEDLRQATGNLAQGQVMVQAGRPGQALSWTAFDDAPGTTGKVGSGTGAEREGFSLSGQGAGLRWHYAVRDFSKAGFTYPMAFYTLTVLFLLSAILLIWPTRGLRLAWVEPVALFVLYAFIAVRCIMLWRIGTFPPTDHTKDTDIDSYTGFEFELTENLGHYPATLLFVVLFFVIVIGYRLIKGDIFRFKPSPPSDDPDAVAPIPPDVSLSVIANEPQQAPSFRKEPRQWSSWLWKKTRKWATAPGNRTVLLHTTVMVSFAVLFKFHALPEKLKRMVSILVPVASYLWYVQQLHRAHASAIWTAGKPKGHTRKEWTETPSGKVGVRKRLSELVQYGYDSRETLLSLITFVALLAMDRGFAVIFLLFLLLKTIVVSFARRPFIDADGANPLKLFARGRDYWIYGIFSIFTYLLFLRDHALFEFLLYHFWWVVGVLLLVTAVYTCVLLKQYKWQRNIMLGAVGFIAMISICFYGRIDRYIHKEVEHVRYRASMIHRQAEDIIRDSEHNTFEERKILETAEGQWFINSYLNQPYDPQRRIDFQPYFNRGVDYITQTRDVVLPRFVISELGPHTTALLLVLLALPMIAWFLGYRLYGRRKKDQKPLKGILYNGYAGMMATVLLFSIGLFVWLSATNRFVWFGQDFPMLSLASRVSLMLPLLLLLFLLCSRPGLANRSLKYNGSRMMMLGLLAVAIGGCIWLTGRSNVLDSHRFTVKMSDADSIVSMQVNGMLQNIQDSLDGAALDSRTSMGAEQLLHQSMNVLREAPAFTQLVADLGKANLYTQSILKTVVAAPSTANSAQSPIYLRYDDALNRWSMEYNRSVFVEMPPVRQDQQWAGDLYEWVAADSLRAVTLIAGGRKERIPDDMMRLYPYKKSVKVAIIPASWLTGERPRAKALISVNNGAEVAPAVLSMSRTADNKGPLSLDVRGFAEALPAGALVYVAQGDQPWTLRFDTTASNVFARNLFVNGAQRLFYPLGERCQWAAHYAQATSQVYDHDSLIGRNVPVTLSYALTDSVSWIVEETLRQHRRTLPKGYRFGVIAADGDGNVRLMADAVETRIPVDPNDQRAVHALELKNFFRRQRSLEREQFGNINLLQMSRGPGSSIKPVIAAAVASGVNAGWERLWLTGCGQLGTAANGRSKIESYAGLDIRSSPWVNSEDGAGEFRACDFNDYLIHSVNLYHSLLLFLGSYPKDRFEDPEHRFRLSMLIKPQQAGSINHTPMLALDGADGLRLPSWSNSPARNAWPETLPGDPKSLYFGNPASILAEALNVRFRLYVFDFGKQDRSIYTHAVENIGDTLVYDSLKGYPSGDFLWSHPENSSFIQDLRVPKMGGPIKNFQAGLLHPSRGGTPYQITPFKMAEMFGTLATGNGHYRMRLSPTMPTYYQPFKADDTWKGNTFDSFVAQHIFSPMASVLEVGTAKELFSHRSKYLGVYCYAKTGTIGEGEHTKQDHSKSQSRRLALILSNEDLTKGRTANTRIWTVFFTADKISDLGILFPLYEAIVDKIINNASFIAYMNLQPAKVDSPQ